MDMSSISSIAHGTSWESIVNWIVAYIGASTAFPALASNGVIWDSVKLLILGSVVETGRRLFRWVVDRFKIRYSITAEFRLGNPTYDWLISYLTTEKVWRTPHDFVVETASSQRKWKMQTAPEHNNVDYVPVHGSMQFFRWKGYICEVTKSHRNGRIDEPVIINPYGAPSAPVSNSLVLTMYTLDSSVLYSFVEECRLKYAEVTKPHVIVHSIGGRDDYDDGPPGQWGTVKTKHRRPLDSLLLDGNKIESLLADAREFLELADWYLNAGIPHRRGYLLHGPPGTGKTSTVYTIAGELGLEIFSLSLSTAGLDDGQLARTVSSLPPRGILLIEDIDCAFPARDEEGQELEDFAYSFGQPRRRRRVYQRSQITLSGLLNVLDGIGSEEGKIFFATTNHVDRLDHALLRPGRIDRKIEYKLASQMQARALFNRFFPAARFADTSDRKMGKHFEVQYAPNMVELADTFARKIPEHEFSVAELQGYLLDWKMKPLDAVEKVDEWIESERRLRLEREARETERRERLTAAKVQEQLHVNSAVIAGLGSVMAQGQIPALTTSMSSRGPSPPTMNRGTVSPVTNSEEGPDNVGTTEAIDSPPTSPMPSVSKITQ